MDCRSQQNICQIVQKKITNYFYGLQISEKYMPNCSEKITYYFYGLQISAKYMPNCLEKNYKLFLQIVDLRERYAKLFTNVRDRTYQNADANGCNGSEVQRTNTDNI